jgi:hypothetical protein
VLDGQELRVLLKKDEKLLSQLRSHNLELRRDFLSLRKSGRWREVGYFSAQESDRLEELLFRYHAIHSRLLEIAERYAGFENSSPGGKLRMDAHGQILAQAKFAVEAFAGDEVAIEKMNQRFPRSEIPARTYDHLLEVLDPELGRQVKHLSRKVEDRLSLSSYEVQAEVFFRVSRFKSPRAHLIHFSEAQKKQVIEMLEPGDIILTYTSGYISSVFIPGKFKHAIVYVGSVNDRKKAGLLSSKGAFPGGAFRRKKWREDVLQSQTSKGLPANVIEAVAEGVKFSNLEYLMDTHVNRLAVIRPLLTPQQRSVYLSRVFSYLGQEYDFEFDFADASRQVCTEVVYRSLNGIAGIDYKLKRHSGRLAMTADDMIDFWICEQPKRFKFVLLADESPKSSNHAVMLLTGAKGERALKRLMSQ